MQIELLVVESDTWNYVNERKHFPNLRPLNGIQRNEFCLDKNVIY